MPDAVAWYILFSQGVREGYRTSLARGSLTCQIDVEFIPTSAHPDLMIAKPIALFLASAQSRLWLSSALLLSLLMVGACDKTPSMSKNPLLKEGQQFPTFVLEAISDGDTASNLLHEKMLVVNVWATWCPPCRREMPGLEKLSKTLNPQHFAVIGLSVDEDVLLASEFLNQQKITFSNFFDKGGVMAKQLGLLAYPETFVIAPNRTLVRRMTGYHEWSSPEVVQMLEDLYQAQKGP